MIPEQHPREKSFNSLCEKVLLTFIPMDTLNGNAPGQGFPEQATLTVRDALLHGTLVASLGSKGFLSICCVQFQSQAPTKP